MWNIDASPTHLSLEGVRELASQVANAYLQGGTPPTDTLVKMAQERELLPHQIEVVAAEANKAIHTVKYAGVEDKYFAADFPLCDAKAVIGSVQVVPQVKVASVIPAPIFNKPEQDLYKAFGIQNEPMDKTASVRGDLRGMAEKLAHLQGQARDELIMAKMSANDVEVSFIKQARQIALENENSADRLRAIGAIYKFAQEGKVANVAKPVLAKLAHVLKSEGKLEKNHANTAINFFTKEADEKAPESLISENLQNKMMVINGDHPLYITLKTMDDRFKRVQGLHDGSKVIEDRLNVVRQKIREL